MRTKALVIALLAVLPSPAFAYDWSTVVHITAVETTGAPDLVTFWVDGAAGTCPDGQGLGPQLTWTARSSTADKLNANGQSALATLLTARASGRPVKIFGRNSDCQIEFMYLN